VAVIFLSLLILWPLFKDVNFEDSLSESKENEMPGIRRICIYGNSVILGTLGLNLRNYPEFEVINLIPPLPEIQELTAWHPEVVLFDIQATSPQTTFSLLDSCPEMRLIGVSSDSNVVKVWSGKQLRELSTRDLMKLVDGQIKDPGFGYSDNLENR
jgi:hypothetical protein